MGDQDILIKVQELLRTALNLADKYSGPDKQQLIDAESSATRLRSLKTKFPP
jgi:hypothetical protein